MNGIDELIVTTIRVGNNYSNSNLVCGGENNRTEQPSTDNELMCVLVEEQASSFAHVEHLTRVAKNNAIAVT
jgi:hypothetical protein